MLSLCAAVPDTSASLYDGLIEMEVEVVCMTCGHCTFRVEDALAVRTSCARVWILLLSTALLGTQQ